MSVSETEAWFTEEWLEPESPLPPATYNSVLEACAELFNDSDLKFIAERDFDLEGLVRYLDCFLDFTKQKKTAAAFLREKEIAVPEISYRTTFLDRVANFAENNSGKLALGAIVLMNVLQPGLFSRKVNIAWPEETKAELAQVAEPSAQQIAQQIVNLRKLAPNEVDQHADAATPGGIELEVQSFSTWNYYDVKVDLMKRRGHLDTSTTYDARVHAGGYIDDGKGFYDGDKSSRQDVELYSSEDVGGKRIWEAEDWQFVAGQPLDYEHATVHIDSLPLPTSFKLSLVNPNSKLVRSAVRTNVVWSKYLEAEVDEALRGNIQLIEKPKE